AKHHVLIGNFAIKVRLRECTTRGWWLGPAASAGPLRGPPSFWAPAIAAYTSRTTAAPPMHLKVTRDSRTLSQNGQRIYLPAHLEYARLRRTRGLGGSLDAPVFLRQTQMLLNRGQASFDILHAIRSRKRQQSKESVDRGHYVAYMPECIETRPTKKGKAKQE